VNNITTAGSGTVLEEDDYQLFEASRNKEVSALSAEYAAMLRRQRVMIGMAEIYVKRVPPARRDGVIAAMRVQNEDLMQMRRRFAQCIQSAVRAQSRVFDARMRFESESSMLLAGLSRSSRFIGAFFRKRKRDADASALQEKVAQSVAELKDAMDDWGQSMSMIYRLLPEWRRMQDEMVCFAETQQGAYRKMEQTVSGNVGDECPTSIPQAPVKASPLPRATPSQESAQHQRSGGATLPGATKGARNRQDAKAVTH
jgi:hypothetical protein